MDEDSSLFWLPLAILESKIMNGPISFSFLTSTPDWVKVK